MTDQTPTPNRDAPTAADAERTPTSEVADVRTLGTKRDRSQHRNHTWLYEDLLA